MDTISVKLALALAAVENSKETDTLDVAKEAYNWIMEGATLTDGDGKPLHLRPVN